MQRPDDGVRLRHKVSVCGFVVGNMLMETSCAQLLTTLEFQKSSARCLLHSSWDTGVDPHADRTSLRANTCSART